MSSNSENRNFTNPTRRRFLATSAGLAGTAAIGSLPLAHGAYAAGSDVITIGLIGCGGRGSGAAVNAMNAGKDIRLVAMADIFDDKLQASRANLKKLKPEQVAVDDDHCFVGFDAYQKVIECVDVVLIAATSHFHPVQLKAAVAAGKHVFCEKPHGIDVPGLKMAEAACKEAQQKKLSLVSGLCWRYDTAVRETMKRIQDGAIGDVIAVQENYLTSPYRVQKVRNEEWTETEYQFRNWYHFNWLSGDQTAQQLIHSIDKSSWVMGDVPPVKAWGMGGAQVCLDPIYGDQFDHHGVVFEYENGVNVFGFCRDIPGCHNVTSDVVFGTKGKAFMPSRCRIEGETKWRYDGPKSSMYDNEHKELFDAVRSGNPINNADYMITTSMLAILAQMVCYTGKEITWEKAMQSKLDFSLDRYDWDAEAPIKPDPDGRYATPKPGITPFV